MPTHLTSLATPLIRAAARDLRRRRIEQRMQAGIDRAGGAVRRVAADVDDLQVVLRDALDAGTDAVAPLARSRRTRALAIGAIVVVAVAVLAVVVARRRRPADDDGATAAE